MTRLIGFIAAFLVSIGLASCYAYPYYEPQTVMTPASFDRSWDAALGAAADAGVQVTSADRAAGRITGTKNGAAVTILLQRQASGDLQVSMSAPDSRETNPTLNERWLGYYQRRMGR